MIETDLHPAQAEMLRVLLFKPVARFSELNVTNLTNDHFSFHLKKLVEIELIKKTEEGNYQLSAKGKEFANRMDTDTAKMEKQAKVAVLVVGVRKKNRKTEFLLQKRLKQPFYGYCGFVTGKIRWGELVEEAGKRELLEETGLRGDLKFTGIEHKVDYDDEGKLLEDKFFYVMRGENLTGELMEEFEGGQNLWVEKSKVKEMENLFQDVLDLVKLVSK